MKLETHLLSGFNTWTAYDADRYDGAEDAGPQIVGEGKTEREAIADFCEKLTDALDEAEDELKQSRKRAAPNTHQPGDQR